MPQVQRIFHNKFKEPYDVYTFSIRCTLNCGTMKYVKNELTVVLKTGCVKHFEFSCNQNKKNMYTHIIIRCIDTELECKSDIFIYTDIYKI